MYLTIKTLPFLALHSGILFHYELVDRVVIVSPLDNHELEIWVIDQAWGQDGWI